MRIDKFVLDSNIWVSYLITKKEQKLIDIIKEADLTVYSCDELYEEIERVLQYPHLQKYKVNISYALKLLKKFTLHHTLVYPIKRYLPDDENDDYLIALALQTSAGFITSGDDDILSQKQRLKRNLRNLKF